MILFKKIQFSEEHMKPDDSCIILTTFGKVVR